MQKVTCDCFQEFIVKCVDYRLKYLNSIANSVRYISCDVIEFIKNKSSSIVKDIVNLVDNDVIDEITSSVEKQCKAKDQAFLSKCDIADVISLYHYICQELLMY